MFTSLLFSLLFEANAVPLQLTQQGRLLDGSGASVTGVHTLTFRVYTASTGGSVLWSESLTVQFNNGYYATILGTDTQNNALDSDTLLNYPVYLEVQLDANAPMTPRQSVTSAPYAQIAGIAESVMGGPVDADNVSIQGSPVVDATGTWVGQPVTPLWTNVQGIPSGFADDVDDVLSSGQVETYIENASSLNLANSTTVGGNSIVTSATVLQPNWSNIQGKPAGFLDDTDNVLSASEVESYVESTSTLNLNSNTQIGGASILTPTSNLNWNNLQNVPTGLADGDELDILDSNCSSGEIVSWTGSDWDCVSDNTLTPSEVGNYLNNNAYTLNVNTTLDGATILTDVDNTLVGLGMSCQDGDIARYDATGEWYCDADVDTDTQLSESEVETFVTNGSIDLATGSQVNGSNIVTTATDANTQLSESEVETFVTNGAVSLASGTTLNGQTIVTTATDSDTQLSESEVETFVTNGSIGLAAGSTMNGATIVTTATDTDTQLSESEVETFITNGSIDLATGSQVNGSNIVTTATDSDTLAGLNCSTDEIAKYNGSAWVCATESSGGGSGGLSYTAMYEVTATSSSTPFAQCNDNDDILISGGCNSTQTQIWASYPEGATDSSSASGWKCYAGNVSVTATAICLTQ